VLATVRVCPSGESAMKLRVPLPQLARAETRAAFSTEMASSGWEKGVPCNTGSMGVGVEVDVGVSGMAVCVGVIVGGSEAVVEACTGKPVCVGAQAVNKTHKTKANKKARFMVILFHSLKTRPLTTAHLIPLYRFHLAA